jgi:hypothetical protein
MTSNLFTPLNNETYAYVSQGGTMTGSECEIESGAALIERQIISDSSAGIDRFESLLTSERLRLAIPHPDRPNQMFITSTAWQK